MGGSNLRLIWSPCIALVESLTFLVQDLQSGLSGFDSLIVDKGRQFCRFCILRLLFMSFQCSLRQSWAWVCISLCRDTRGDEGCAVSQLRPQRGAGNDWCSAYRGWPSISWTAVPVSFCSWYVPQGLYVCLICSAQLSGAVVCKSAMNSACIGPAKILVCLGVNLDLDMDLAWQRSPRSPAIKFLAEVFWFGGGGGEGVYRAGLHLDRCYVCNTRLCGSISSFFAICHALGCFFVLQ